jgi:hypothetical protein
MQIRLKLYLPRCATPTLCRPSRGTQRVALPVTILRGTDLTVRDPGEHEPLKSDGASASRTGV